MKFRRCFLNVHWFSKNFAVSEQNWHIQRSLLALLACLLLLPFSIHSVSVWRRNIRTTRMLRKAVKVMKLKPSINWINFVWIDPKRVDVVTCIDAWFATNKERSSQSGILVILRDAKFGLVNVAHYSCTKSKRICKSAPAAKLFALVGGYDTAAAIRDAIQEATGLANILLVLYTDSKSLYGLRISLSPTGSG